MHSQILKDTLRLCLSVSVSLGILTLALVISDTALASHHVTRNINDDPTNFDPEAFFTVRSNAGMNYQREGTRGQEFTFDARNSRDPEGTQLKYRWDFDGDGNYDTSLSTDAVVTHTYYELGTFEVKLAVRDEAGFYDHYVQDVVVVQNTKPSAFFVVEPEQGSPAQEFRFDANESYDDQYRDRQLEYRWDFDGDGLYDTDWSHIWLISNFTYGYGFKGVQRVTLEVRDPENQRDTFTREVEILENTVPVAVLDVDPKVGTFETLFTLSASNSFDDETEFSDLKFRWDTEYSGPNDIIYDGNFLRRNSFKHIRYVSDDQRTGPQKVRVEVMDEDGKVGTAITTLDIHWASPYLQILDEERILYLRNNAIFNPDTPVPRGEVVRMILLKMGVNPNRQVSLNQVFSDVTQDTRNAHFINEAFTRGIIQGYPNGTFRPNGDISRAEVLSMIIRAFDIQVLSNGPQLFPDVRRGEWYFQYVDTGHFNELVSGYENGRFGPHDPITFGEIAKLLVQADQMEEIN